MEVRDRKRPAARVAADLVQRREPEVAVERRVLDAFRRHRPGRLLKAHDELLVPGFVQEEDVTQLLGDIGASDLLAVTVLDDAGVRLYVRAVDLERRERE